MPCTPTASVLVAQVAFLLLPLPLSATVAQPAIGPPPSALKLTLPVGFAPVTVAVKVTVAPANAGVPDVASVVVVGLADSDAIRWTVPPRPTTYISPASSSPNDEIFIVVSRTTLTVAPVNENISPLQ